MISTADFGDLTKNAKVQWDKVMDQAPRVRNVIADIVSVTEENSEHSSISKFPMARRKARGADAQKASTGQGYTVNFTQQTVALQADVEYELRKFDKYNEIMRLIRELSGSTNERMEFDLAAYLTYAWATSYTNIDGETVSTSTPDGLALIDDTHTPNKSADTWSNEIDTTHSPISTSVLEGLEQKFNTFLDEGKGRPLFNRPTHILHGRHSPTKHEISRILKSNQEAGTANNDVNTFKGVYTQVEVPYLGYEPSGDSLVKNSDKDRFVFLAALDGDTKGLRMEVSEEARLVPPEQVFESRTWEYMSQALYDTGLMNPAWIAGTKGDGTLV